MARLFLKIKKVTAEEIGTEIKKIIRKATEKDYEVLEVNNVKALEYGKKSQKDGCKT